jgi:hypothetical protein
VINRVKELIGMSGKSGARTPVHDEIQLSRAAAAFESEAGPDPVGPAETPGSPPAVAADSADPQESWVADAFAALFAEEQGEPASPLVVVNAARELSDAEIDRIAARVAERLTQGSLGQTVSRIVSDVSERLVREEIERIRSGAQAKNA